VIRSLQPIEQPTEHPSHLDHLAEQRPDIRAGQDTHVARDDQVILEL
jgi:hypothetical protein